METHRNTCVCVYKAFLGSKLCRAHAIGKKKCFIVITLLFESSVVVIMI